MNALRIAILMALMTVGAMGQSWTNRPGGTNAPGDPDPIWNKAPALGIKQADIDAWNRGVGTNATSAISRITDTDTSRWTTAWVWGDHGTQSYVKSTDATYTDTVAKAGSALQSYTETDPVWGGVSGTVVPRADSGYLAWLWGNHLDMGYLLPTSSVVTNLATHQDVNDEGVIVKAAAYDAMTAHVDQVTADMATGDFVRVESDPGFAAISNRVVYTNDATYTDTVAKAGSALQSYTETDPGFMAASNALTTKANNGQTAFNWGFWGTPTSSIIPTVSNSFSLGSLSFPFAHGYFGTNSIYFDTNKFSVRGGKIYVNDALAVQDETDPIWSAYKASLLARLAVDENNIMLNAFRIQTESTMTYKEMVQGWVDGYVDQTGINTGVCINALYNSGSRYFYGGALSLGKASVFNGSTCATNHYSGTPFDMSGDFTVTCWVYPTAWDDPESEIFNWNDYDLRVAFGGAADGKEGYLKCVVANNDRFSNGPGIPLNAWTFVSYVYDNDTDTIKFFTNGVACGSQSTANLPNSSGHFVSLGDASGGWGFNFTGYYDDLVVYEVEKTEEQLFTLWNNGDGTPVTGDSPDVGFIMLFDNNLNEDISGTFFDEISGTVTYTDGKVGSVSVTNIILVSTNYPTDYQPTEIDAMFVVYTNGAPTLNTQIVAKVSANNGTNYQTVTLSDLGQYDTTKRFYGGSITNITNPGNRLMYKIETTNAVDVRFYGSSLMYR